jgi:hypothetical protein
MNHSPIPVDLADRFVKMMTGQGGNIMTMNQASHLRMRWEQRADPRSCKHLNLELEHGNDNYLTDNYHCTACGELVVANTREPIQVV